MSAGELAVQRHELGPVLGLVDVKGRDRRLELVGTVAAEGERAIERCLTFRDLIAVPERAILIAQKDDGAVGEAGVAASVVQQHQREERVHVGLVRHQLCERAPEPDRLGRELSTTAVALVEDQVDDREHCGEPIGQQVRPAAPETGWRRP